MNLKFEVDSFKIKEVRVKNNIFLVNKRAMMTLDRSPDTTASKQCLKQASWPSLITTEANM
jgi:hypothetical protein